MYSTQGLGAAGSCGIQSGITTTMDAERLANDVSAGSSYCSVPPGGSVPLCTTAVAVGAAHPSCQACTALWQRTLQQGPMAVDASHDSGQRDTGNRLLWPAEQETGNCSREE